MRAPAVLAVAACLAAAGWIGAAHAGDCRMPHRSCLAQCDQDFPASRDDMGHAGCLARCGLDHATCEAHRAYDETQAALENTVKPWLADQAGRWQRFLDGFRQGRDGGEAPNSPAPRSGPPRSAPPDSPPEPGSRRTTPL
jgi:hypothetical protein